MNENAKWMTYDGRSIAVKDLTDDHLINIVYHVQQPNYGTSAAFFRVLMEQVQKRGLTQKDLDRAQIPHVINGEKRMWNYNKHNFEVV